jgi:hypothetical protein
LISERLQHLDDYLAQPVVPDQTNQADGAA